MPIARIEPRNNFERQVLQRLNEYLSQAGEPKVAEVPNFQHWQGEARRDGMSIEAFAQISFNQMATDAVLGTIDSDPAAYRFLMPRIGGVSKRSHPVLRLAAADYALLAMNARAELGVTRQDEVLGPRPFDFIPNPGQVYSADGRLIAPFGTDAGPLPGNTWVSYHDREPRVTAGLWIDQENKVTDAWAQVHEMTLRFGPTTRAGATPTDPGQFL